jgi:dienelactone hydrolase
LKRPRLDTLAERWAKLEPDVEAFQPASAGPWPTVVLFHGCGGRRPYLDDYVDALNDAGMMAVVVDSFAPRGISRSRALATVCTGAELPGWKRAGDVLAALWGVRQLVGVDAEALALAGWSHGGWSIMDLMTMPLARPGEAGVADPDPALVASVKALALAYPYCGPGALTQLRPWRASPHVFAFVGEADRVADPRLCRRAFRTVERSGAKLTTWYPPGATHAFDEHGNAFAWFRYDEDLAAEARSRLTGFLAGVFPPRTRGLAPALNEP